MPSPVAETIESTSVHSGSGAHPAAFVRNYRASERRHSPPRNNRFMSTPAPQETASKPLDIAWVRQQFPSLHLRGDGQPPAFLDGPAGTQVPKQVIEAVQNYFLTANANTCGAFATSRRNDAMIATARAAMADFFH